MKLIVVLGDQLSDGLSALRVADKSRDIVIMAEVRAEARYVRHHPRKIALIFSAMRHFAEHLKQDGWQVRYTQYDATQNAGSITGELLRAASLLGADEVVATRPGEWRLIQEMEELPLKLTMLEDDRFIASHAKFEQWAKGRRTLRMEYFYREMRRATGLLMDDGAPAGGQWNFDQDNRKPAKGDMDFPEPPRFEPDEITRDVLALVGVEFAENFGTLDGYGYATTRSEALEALEHFVTRALPRFGDYQDAMLRQSRWLFHSILSPYLNIGLLDPLEVCRAAQSAYRAGTVPINAAEGFIRQILGWREYVRGIYFLEGPDYTARNALGQTRDLPALYWGGATRMRCLSAAIEQTREEAYAHHIQRLMVTGNFALLAGVDPAQVHEWYLEVYIDAFEWVEAPNTIGMSQFADGGIIASKPYVSSGAYINRMSDYCKSCHYKVSAKTGEQACPFNLLYWDFLYRHRARFETNPRMGNMYRTWDRMTPERQEVILRDASEVLRRLEIGQV